jgi:hypothetical protein
LNLHASIVSVQGPPLLHFELLKLLNFDFNADPDPAFQSTADPDQHHCSLVFPFSTFFNIPGGGGEECSPLLAPPAGLQVWPPARLPGVQVGLKKRKISAAYLHHTPPRQLPFRQSKGTFTSCAGQCCGSGSVCFWASWIHIR